MLREKQYILRQASGAVDLLLIFVAFLFAHALRTLLSIYITPDLLPPSRIGYYGWLGIAAPLVFVIVLAWNGFYQPQRLGQRPAAAARTLVLVCFEAMLLLVALDFMFGDQLAPGGGRTTSRAMILILPPLVWGLLMLRLWALRLILRRRQALDLRRVVLVGSGRPLVDFAAAVTDNPLWGIVITGIITDRPELQGPAFDPAAVPEAALGPPVLADLVRAPEALWSHPIDEVIFLPESVPLARLRPLFEVCEEMGVRTHLPLNFFKGRIARPVIDALGEIPVLSYWPTRDIGPALLFKYAFDRVAASLALVVLSPLLLGVALAVRLSSPRGAPVLFRQTRCGLNGRLFTLYKFRTMRPGAEAERDSLVALNEQSGPVFKIRRDPRVTTLGRFLRKYSIDELPQLWNVLRGEMSLVGPRPPLPGEVAQYDRWQRRRLSMKPGITCLWQVGGRNTLPFDTWMKLDLHYIDNWSLTLDFRILARTVYVVLTGHGAM